MVNNPLITMVINHTHQSWDDPPVVPFGPLDISATKATELKAVGGVQAGPVIFHRLRGFQPDSFFFLGGYGSLGDFFP